MQLKKLILTDFKGIRSAEYDFSEITKIMGQNGSGKSTIATAWFWLWMDKDYELKSNPNIRPNGVEESLPRVEAVLDINGTEITIAKQQKRTVGKPNDKGISKITLSNTYEINKVPKTERDFRSNLEAKGIVFDKFLALSHPEVFTGQKAADMRKILFEMVSEKSDLDIAMMDPSTSDVTELLKTYKFEEIEAMHKASKKKAEQQVKSIPDQIVGMEKSKADIDTAELELLKSDINGQIEAKEDMIADSSKAAEEYEKRSQGILDIKFKISDIEREASEKLMSEKRNLQNEIDEASRRFYKAELEHKKAEQDISSLNSELETLEKKKVQLQNEWKQIKTSTFREYEELPVLDESALICPTCGQDLPEEIKLQKIANYEIHRQDHKSKYDAEKESFEKDRKFSLSKIEERGNETVASIKNKKERLQELSQQIEQCKVTKVESNKKKTELQNRLDQLPVQPDLADNQEYELLCLQVQKMEEALHKENNQTDYRASLQAEISELRRQLDDVNAELGKAANNVRIDEQISEMQKKQREYEQAKADSEKILYQLSLVSKKKNELLVEEINANFGMVKWVLFDYQKNGEYKETCIPTVDGRRFGDSTNTGREIVAKLDICNSLQKFFGINLPVFLDNAESINDFNIPDMDCQLILMNVTEDASLRLEDVA